MKTIVFQLLHQVIDLKEEMQNLFTIYKNMVFRMRLTDSEIGNKLDVKYIPTSSIGYTLPTGIYEVNDFDWRIISLLPDEVQVNITIDDIRLRSNSTNNKTIRFY